ncbi:MAG: CPBP family intramembrane metalloprotease [Deltaproteobacteria bacterium]|nr:CPBP family intramembrane metalloprotease [Deltaproteobacteria bacterium]
MDRIEERSFLATMAVLVGLELASSFVYGLHWARGVSPLAWTAMVRSLDILLFFLLFRIFSVPLAAAGLQRPVMGAGAGLAVSVVLGMGFFLALFTIRSLWGLDLRVFVDPGLEVRRPGALVVLCILGPFAEEIFFRGLCYGVIRVHLGVWPSTVISAFLFGAVHLVGGGFSAMAVPLAGGIVLALLYEFAGSLVAPSVLHGAANLILFSGILWT